MPSSLLAEDDDTATLRVTYDGRGPDDFYLDPGLVEGIAGDPAWTILVNTNNGLLAFAREGGIAGTALEPDLAAKLPDVSANGRVYSFKVRSGVRFSDSEDRTVQPTDVKWSIERALYLESPGRRYLLNIAGASEAKPSNPKGIRGIRVNDADRSVQITLNRPDPGFLKVLAMPWTFVVPEGTPYNDKSGSIPATGPYVIRRYERDRLVQLAPNPNWSATSERDKSLPPKRLNRIEVSIGVDPRNALERIRSGESDLTLSPILPADLKRFEGRREVSIKEKKPIGAIYAFFLNTSIAPFDDRRVRRAVNLAVNRKTLAGFYADQAVQTAQVIPPGIPGYKWRGVRAPDPKDAQKLIKQANLSPSERRVTIWVPRNDPPAIAASGYLKSVLEDLSLTVKITYLDRFVYEDKIGRASTKAQIGYLSWFSTLPDGGDIFGHLDGTQIKNEANPNPSYYSASDELIKEARTKSGEARDRAWTKVDDSVSEEVPWVPFANGTRSDLISSRVQGYVYHPVFGQLWSLMTVK